MNVRNKVRALARRASRHRLAAIEQSRDAQNAGQAVNFPKEQGIMLLMGVRNSTAVQRRWASHADQQGR